MPTPCTLANPSKQLRDLIEAGHLETTDAAKR
jgi:hypothetical protein